MVGGTGGEPMDAEAGASAPARPRGRTRRGLARGLRRWVLAAALAVPPAAAPGPSHPASGSRDRTGDIAFDLTYRGRRVRGMRIGAHGADGADPAGEDERWHVTVDGRPLHLMRRADGTWLSMVDHYCSSRTPLDAARAAVDELGPGRRLRTPAAGHPHPGERHGVRA
ncbi:hypothetical protein ADL00_39560 [Streptomyces sp. AS58]|uniref:Tyrosinase n=1 Tax=Streptomyces cadmiisoli TaxID=2184053 RepID=A0A2Z4J5A6_9ACTN|nr:MULTISPECIES: tyrosinase family oxidase copper chaperone [Streptomyces]AWW39513.1 tyrosinase [Streptomyces cadmiisoli]KOV51878.1 hypothetical protein ADL00_39560 [Streptomyces sp. AS58]